MKRIISPLFVVFIIFSSSVTFAQTQKNDVRTKTVYSESFEKGATPGQIAESKEEFDAQGNTLKEYDYNKEGKLKNYTVYTYKAGKKETETLFAADGKIIEKNVYTYNTRGDKVTKVTFNAANKMIKKKIYSYEYFQ